jgi:predicted PurR-regulated permease PerM
MSYLKINSKNIIILVLNILFIYMLFYNLFYKKKESFSVNDIDNVVGDIKNVTKSIEKIPDEINNIDKKLTQQVTNVESTILKKTEEMGKEIEKNTTNMLKEKLQSIFIQIGDIFNKGIIEPILTLFNGIGNIFVEIFNILKEIGNKIAALPNCIITYAIKETTNTLNSIYHSFMPKFLKNIISPIYNYTLGYIFGFIGYITGYTSSVERCYGFNISKQVDNINSNLNTINDSFKQNFGNIDFSQIKI